MRKNFERSELQTISLVGSSSSVHTHTQNIWIHLVSYHPKCCKDNASPFRQPDRPCSERHLLRLLSPGALLALPGELTLAPLGAWHEAGNANGTKPVPFGAPQILDVWGAWFRHAWISYGKPLKSSPEGDLPIGRNTKKTLNKTRHGR